MKSINLLSGVIALLVVQGLVQSVLSSDYFSVTEIDLVWPSEMNRPVERCRLNPPTPIFYLDLKAVAQVLERQRPTAEVESVRRILPNRLMAVMVPKRPIAQVRVSGGYAPVDEGGRTLMPPQAAPWPHLPILFLDGSRSGFSSACRLLQGMGLEQSIAGHPVNSIRCRGDDLFLFLDSGLEIRFNSDRLEPGWARLAQLLGQKPELLNEAKYIDLRFGDPVIGGGKAPLSFRRTLRLRSGQAP
ncbi:MAG: hypothetical protein HY211_06520 [Candidatus Omnitrophica bacterium]|nr:hypothetical protein [Candidatus Omnitrophota bacterium]